MAKANGQATIAEETSVVPLCHTIHLSKDVALQCRDRNAA
jgi:hypothetical protein